jgi:Xaa-Pro aminopeptidase
MAADGLDGLLLANSMNLVYLAGYQSTVLTLARPFYLVVPRRGEPVLLVHRTRPWEAARHSWIADVRTYDRLSVAPVAELAAIIAELGLARAGRRIGAELGFEQRLGIPPAEWERVVAALAPAAVVDAAELLWRLRRLKDSDEIGVLREAGRVTAVAYGRLFTSLAPGQEDRAVSHRMKVECLAAGGGSAWAMIGGGNGCCDLGIGLGIGRRYEPGEMVWLDAGASVQGYWADYSRAAVLGRASSGQRDAWAAIQRLTAEGVALCRSGIPVAEIAVHCNEGVRAIGGRVAVTLELSTLAARIGHGIGLESTEPPHVSESDPTVLEPGMVVSIEPGIATVEGIFHAEQNVLVTRDEPEVLSVAPSELLEVPA